jgi:hypothetical protein
MNIGSVPYQTFPSMGYAISVSQSGRTSLPVSPSAYIYSQFKHVSGTPAPEGTPGVNINKLRIIDTLIEQLTKMKKMPEIMDELYMQNGDNRINAMIDQYQNQIRSIQTANANNPYAPLAPLTGSVFSLSV